MRIELSLRNIIIIGQIQPGGYDRYSLITGNIVSDEQILSPSVFSERGVNVVTRDFNLLILPNQIALNAVDPNSDFDIKETFIKLITLPVNMQPTGLGINFNWYLFDEQKSLADLSRDLFYNEKISILSKFFDEPNARFGTYASVDFLDSRLKLDIKPLNIKVTNDSRLLDVIEVMNFQYNFHFDIDNEQDKGNIVNWLSNYDRFKIFSQEITFSYK